MAQTTFAKATAVKGRNGAKAQWLNGARVWQISV
jgi:hypothetical protein